MQKLGAGNKSDVNGIYGLEGETKEEKDWYSSVKKTVW